MGVTSHSVRGDKKEGVVLLLCVFLINEGCRQRMGTWGLNSPGDACLPGRMRGRKKGGKEKCNT